MDREEQQFLAEKLNELRAFTGKQARHYAFKTYSKPFLVLWLREVAEFFGVKVAYLDRFKVSLRGK